MWKYAEKVTMSMKSKYVNGTIVTIFRENVLILATYWQLEVCDNFDNFFVWQFWFWQHTGNWGFVTIMTFLLFDNFDLGNILAAGLWQEHMVVTELNVETLWGARFAHFYTGTILKCSPGFIILHFCTLFTFSSLFLHENTAKWVLATDFTKQIHLRKKLFALLLYWATSIFYKARPGKRCKKSFVYNQSIFYSFSVPCLCSVKSTRSCIFRQFTK